MGEAPGKEENETGIPFTGSSGHLLTQLLKQAGIDRADCYITNVVKYRPPNNQLSRLSEIGLSLEGSSKELREELTTLQPNVIVPLGEVAREAVTGLSGISKWRGSIIRSLPTIGSVKVIPTFHPAYILRMYRSSALCLFDFDKIKREALTANFDSILIREFKINPSFNESLELLNRFSKASVVALDIETDRGANFIKCVGFADDINFAGCIPFIEKDQQFGLFHKNVSYGIRFVIFSPIPTSKK